MTSHFIFHFQLFEENRFYKKKLIPKKLKMKNSIFLGRVRPKTVRVSPRKFIPTSFWYNFSVWKPKKPRRIRQFQVRIQKRNFTYLKTEAAKKIKVRYFGFSIWFHRVFSWQPAPANNKLKFITNLRNEKIKITSLYVPKDYVVNHVI